MYKSIAAYAAAMLETPDRFMPAIEQQSGLPVWGVTKSGKEIYSNLHAAHKVSILGALRAGHDVLGGGARAYNTVDRAVRHAIEVLYPDRDITTVDQQQAVEVLLSVARG